MTANEITFLPARSDMFKALGAACLVRLNSQKGAVIDAEEFQQYYLPPIMLEQIKFYFDDEGEVIGFATWALVTQEVFDRLSESHSYAMHISEWREGAIPLIVDLVATPGAVAGIKKDLIKNLFANTRVWLSDRAASGSK